MADFLDSTLISLSALLIRTDLNWLKMLKIHSVLVKIQNNSGFDMSYHSHWYEHGRLGDGYCWKSIPDNDHNEVLSYERNYSPVGCSGYVQYKMGGNFITVAFSNPSIGPNKCDVGTASKGVWSKMVSQEYEWFERKIVVDDVELFFKCKCTGGIMNTVDVVLSRPTRAAERIASQEESLRREEEAKATKALDKRLRSAEELLKTPPQSVPTVDMKPKMFELKFTHKVVEMVQADWADLAYALHFQPATVNAIKEDAGGVNEACTSVLSRWLDGEGERGPRTWATLLEALTDMGKTELAKEIGKKLLLEVP